MPNNTGFLLLVGLGALLFLGRGRQPADVEEIVDDTVSTTGVSTFDDTIGGFTSTAVVSSKQQSDDTETIVVAKDAVQIGSEVITVTEQAVRRSEQVKKQVFDWSAGVLPSTTIGAAPVSQGDIEAVALEAGEFVYGGAPRPTATAMPVWNNRYGWYWKNPIGGAVGPGGKEWTPGDTSTNMGSPGTNIGMTLPPGWKKNPGGSANWVGLPEHDFEMA